MGRGQNLLNLVKKIKQEKQIEEIKTEIAEVIKPENLKAGITAFGIEGNKNIVDTSDANLNDYYLHPNYIGYSKGNKIKGRMPVSTEDQLQYFSSTQTMLNPEYPNFILLRHYPAGTIKGEIKTISANAINSEWIENKNICIRANYNPNLTYWIHDWHVEIAVCENDCRFQFRNSNGEQPIYCIYKDTGNSAPYTLYQAWCNDLSELTIDNWEKKDIAANSNMNNSLGKIGSLYAYSRDKSVTTTGLTSSTGIMSSKGKIYFKNKLNANTTPSYLSNNNNGAFIDIIDENKLTQFINLIPEHIKKGETYLGIEGTMEEGIDTSDATAVASDIAIGKTAYVNGEKIEGTAATSNIKITDASYLFCKKSRTDYLNEFLALCNNVTNTQWMFNDCKNLTNLDLSNFDTSNVIDMNNMFCGCSNLINLDLSNFDTSRVINMYYMFYNCPHLTDLNLSSFDMSNITNISSMFSNCSKLTNLQFGFNLGKGYTQKTTNNSNYQLGILSSLLTNESLMSVINNLYDLNLTYNVENGGTLYTQKLILGNTNLAKLTAEEIAIATNKGWTVS